MTNVKKIIITVTIDITNYRLNDILSMKTDLISNYLNDISLCNH